MTLHGHLRDIYTRSVTLWPVRVIRWDCGFKATGDGDEELVSRAQNHALEVHGMEMAAEFELGLAKAKMQPPQR